jgi:hypothetical protein
MALGALSRQRSWRNLRAEQRFVPRWKALWISWAAQLTQHRN